MMPRKRTMYKVLEKHQIWTNGKQENLFLDDVRITLSSNANYHNIIRWHYET
jgi:hypothetical protein